MARLFSEYYNISKQVEFDFLDIFLDIDVPYFIDPKLLRTTSIPEFEDAWIKLEKIFVDIIILLKHSSKVNDKYWKSAEKLIMYKEVPGTGLGYTKESHKGHAIGKKLRKDILISLKDLVDKGQEDPVLFELVCVFEKNISFDRLSDLLTALLLDEVITYSERNFSQFGIETSIHKINGTAKRLLKNPFKDNEIVLLLPKEILSPFPLVFEMSDISSYNVVKNEILAEFMRLFGCAFTKSEERSSDKVKSAFYESYDFRNFVIKEYLERDIESYNFVEDPSGMYNWYHKTKVALQFVPISTEVRVINTEEQLLELTFSAIELFRNFVEDQGGWRLLYDGDTPKTEAASQLLFFGVVSHYCDRINVDISKEVNNGRGPVDFKLSQGSLKTIIEFKLSSNKKLRQAVDSQVPIYMKQENVSKAILLVVKVTDTRATNQFISELESEYSKGKILVKVINAMQKVSASIA